MQLTTLVFLGDGKGYFAPGGRYPATHKELFRLAADMTRSGRPDIVLSNSRRARVNSNRHEAVSPEMAFCRDGRAATILTRASRLRSISSTINVRAPYVTASPRAGI
jgi:hypothetical protein